MRTFLCKKSHLSFPLQGGQRVASHAGGSGRGVQEGYALHSSGPLARGAGAICPGCPLRAENPLSFRCLHPLSGLFLLCPLNLQREGARPRDRESKEQMCLEPGPNTTECTRDRCPQAEERDKDSESGQGPSGACLVKMPGRSPTAWLPRHAKAFPSTSAA